MVSVMMALRVASFPPARTRSFSPLLSVFLSLFVLMAALPAGLRAAPQIDLQAGAVVDDTAGVDWKLDGGVTLHLRRVEGTLHALFLDTSRQIIEPEFDAVILRGEGVRKRSDDFYLVLKKGSGPFLTHPRLFPVSVDVWVVPVLTPQGKDAITLERKRFRI